MSYAAATSRLEAQGVEPAAHRTVILPSGSRRGGRSAYTTFSPDLYRMRESMATPRSSTLGYDGQAPQAARPEPWLDVTNSSTRPLDRQGIELVTRLFGAMTADERLPADVRRLISRLHGPNAQLELRNDLR